MQNRDGHTILLRAGETVHTAPGKRHWHGALPDHSMARLAVSETAGDPGTADVNWAEHVVEDEYSRALARLDRTSRKNSEVVWRLNRPAPCPSLL